MLKLMFPKFIQESLYSGEGCIYRGFIFEGAHIWGLYIPEGISTGFYGILAKKKNPIDVSLSQSSMKNHAMKCLENDNLNTLLNCSLKRFKEKVVQLVIYCI